MGISTEYFIQQWCFRLQYIQRAKKITICQISHTKLRFRPVLSVLSDRRWDGVRQLAKMEGKKDQERGERRQNKERVVHQGECDAKDARKSFCFAPKGYLHLWDCISVAGGAYLADKSLFCQFRSQLLHMSEQSTAISKPDPHENKDKHGMKGRAALASKARLDWESVASFFIIPFSFWKLDTAWLSRHLDGVFNSPTTYQEAMPYGVARKAG